jgi:hypothetical protein
VATGKILPFNALFYSWLPAIGQGHLPIRYLMVSWPFLFLSLCIVYNYSDQWKLNRLALKRLGIVFLICPIILAIVFTGSTDTSLRVGRLIFFELFLCGAIVLCIAAYGIKSRKVIALWSVFFVCMSLNFIYGVHDVYKDVDKIKGATIITDRDSKKMLAEYMNSNLPSKELYRFIEIPGEKRSEKLKPFIPYNYAWYGQTKQSISNYSGYPLHGNAPEEYFNISGQGFYIVKDWRYIVDTRCDFLVLGNEYFEENQEFIQSVIDAEVPPAPLSSGYQIVKVKKFYPSFIKGDAYVEDSDKNHLDNGYFYSSDLSNSDVVRFSTDQATYFEVEYDSDKNATLSFLPYNNRHFSYYIDDKIITPTVERMQAFVDVPSGRHVLSIRYEYLLADIEQGFFAVFYGIVLLCAIVTIIRQIARYIRRQKTRASCPKTLESGKNYVDNVA